MNPMKKRLKTIKPEGCRLASWFPRARIATGEDWPAYKPASARRTQRHIPMTRREKKREEMGRM
jgi:hypothetical protein